MENKNETLAKEIKRSVLLFRLFGKKIPAEYHLELISSGECDCKFFTKFIKKHRLSTQCIRVFIDKYWRTVNFVSAYDTAINTYSDITYWILEILKKDYTYPLIKPEQYPNPECVIRITPSVIDEIFAIEDVNILKRFFAYIWRPIGFHKITKKAIETKNMTVISALSVDNGQIGDYEICEIFAKKDKELVEFISQLDGSFNLPLWAVTDLLTHKEYIDIAKKYVQCNYIDDFAISKLINTGNKQLLALYIKRFALSTELQYELAEAGMYDLLKLHYKKHGTNRDVVNYVANLEVFKNKLGV